MYACTQKSCGQENVVLKNTVNLQNRPYIEEERKSETQNKLKILSETYLVLSTVNIFYSYYA